LRAARALHRAARVLRATTFALVVLAPALAHADERTASATAGVAIDVGRSVGGWLDAEAVSRYWDDRTSYVRSHVEAGVRLDGGGPGVSAAQDAEARPWNAELFQLTLRERLAFDVAPRLSDRPDRWRRRYRGAGFDVDMIGLQGMFRHWGVQLIRVDNGWDWEAQLDGGETVRRRMETSDWSPISITRRSHGEEVGRVDLIALEATAIDGAEDGVVMTTFNPRFSNVRIGPVWFDAAYGHAATGWTQTSIDGEVVSRITSDDLPAIHTPAYRYRIGVDTDAVRASAGVERNLHLTADSALVLETRASADLAVTVRDAEVRATGFAARSRIWTAKDAFADHATGGGSLAVDVPVRDLWRVTGAAEVARTFYATVERERALRVDTAVKVDLGLRRTIRNWVPRGHEPR
jgi:hypothetical protein